MKKKKSVCVQPQTGRGPGSRFIINIHDFGASGWNSCHRERNRLLGNDRSQHTLLAAAGGGESVCMLQATHGDAQQQGGAVANMWRLRGEVKPPSSRC